MDQFKNFANQFSGGNANQQQHQGKGQGQQGNEQQQSGFGGNFLGGQQQQQGSSGGGFFGGDQQQQQQGSSNGGGFFGGIGNKLNEAAGGGRESEKNEDYLDKGIDYVQEKFLGQGPQDNESAIEQAKDEQISDFIRGKYKSTTGSDMPIKDKPTRYD